MSPDSFIKNLSYFGYEIKDLTSCSNCAFSLFLLKAWQDDPTHCAGTNFRWKNIPIYCDTPKEPVWYVDSGTGFEKIKKSWAREMCNTPKPNQLVWCLPQLFKIKDSVQFMVSCDGSIHVLWTYLGHVLVLGCIKRKLTKPRLCDYRSIIACYLHMQPWVARFPLSDFQ